MSTDPTCIFCQIVAGSAPASVVAESEGAFAFMDMNQPVPGHVLVIPRAHARDIYEVGDEDGVAVFRLVVQVARAVKRALAPAGITLLQANEPAGGQTVFHFHMHVFARYAGDREQVRLSWQHERTPAATLDDLAKKIRAAL